MSRTTGQDWKRSLENIKETERERERGGGNGQEGYIENEEEKITISWSLNENGQRQCDKKNPMFLRFRTTEPKWLREARFHVTKIVLKIKKNKV